MKERQILFGGPMVAAILAGRKSQTRRVVKPQPCDPSHLRIINEGKVHYTRPPGDKLLDEARSTPGYQVLTCAEWLATQPCPYGRPGDRLWGRETWRRASCGRPIFRADYASETAAIIDGGPHADIRWRPSIHMPRAASRITLDITGVRVEQLLDISEEDAKAEGLGCVTKDGSLYKYGIPDLDGLPGNDNHGWHWKEWERDPRNAYHKLWEQINGPGSAVDNPWVWVIEFKRVEARP